MHLINFFGYLDAGTGSIVIQSLIGVVAGIGVFGRKLFANFGHKLKSLFSRPSGNSSSKTSE